MSKPRTRETVINDTGRLTTMTKDYYILKSSKYLPADVIHSSSDDVISSINPGTSKLIQDYVTPNFVKLQKMGKIINNPLFMESEIDENPVLDVEYTRNTWNHMLLNTTPTEGLYISDNYNGQWDFDHAIGTANSKYLNVVFDTIDVNKLEAIAITNAWASINDSDLLIGACIAESGKTAKDLLTLARKVLKVVKAIRRPRVPKRINKKSVKAAAIEAEELYMQARYNLRPVYYDIMGAMKLTTQKRYADRYTHRANAYESVKEEDSFTSSWHRDTRVTLRVSKLSTYEVEARAGVLCNVQDETRWRRLGISMISDTAWELVPGSFILDWFGTFGSIISAWSPAPGVKPLTSWVTVTSQWRDQVSVEVESINNMDNSSNFKLGYPSRIEVEVSGLTGSKTRIKTQKIRRPNPRRPFTPQITVNLDSLKTLDLAIIGKNLSHRCRSLRSMSGFN